MWKITRAWMNVLADKEGMDFGTTMEREMSVLREYVCFLQMGFGYATVKKKKKKNLNKQENHFSTE